MLHRHFSTALLSIIVVTLAFLSSCRDDEFETSPEFRLSFSVDTLFFDTVFTSIGSATRTVKAYNRGNNPVRIRRILVENDANQSFRVNVDGLSGVEFEDVEIRAGDSLFFFVEVTVDPEGDQLYPFVEGALRFELVGGVQRLPIVAWGWDAIFYPRPQDSVQVIQGLPPFYTIGSPGEAITWTNEKPIVVRNYLVIDTDQRLDIAAGTKIFFHQGAGLWIFSGGRIRALGSVDNPITFQGDRLEPFYAEQPGQWDRIWINEGSEENRLENVIIKNNFIGLQLEPFPAGPQANELSANGVRMRNVVVRNNSITGILSRNYRIDAQNLMLSRAGQHLLVTQGAGQYRFDHCTFANNWNLAIRQSPSLLLTNRYEASAGIFTGQIINSQFRNCIIYGNNQNEIVLDMDEDVNIDLTFSHCLFRAEQDNILSIQQDYLSGQNWVGNQPGFINFSAGDFRLREDAFVRGLGMNAAGLPTNDLIGFPYASPRPLGCLEYMPE